MEELEKGLKDLKGFATHCKNNNINQPDTPELSGTKPPTKEYTWRDPWLRCICSRRWPYLASVRGEALGSVEAQHLSIEEC